MEVLSALELIILAPLVLLVVGGVIAGLVALFSKPGKAARWILGTLGVICVVGFLLLVGYLFVGYRMMQPRAAKTAIVTYPHVIRAPQPHGPTRLRDRRVASSHTSEGWRVENDPKFRPDVYPSVQMAAPHGPTRLRDSRVASSHASECWRVENDPKFKPDAYPSVQMAARALALEAAETLDRVVPREEAPTRIQIFGDAGPDALHAAAAELTHPGPGPNVTVEAVPPERGSQTRPADERTVRMQFDVPAGTRSHRTMKAYEATVHDGGGSLRMRVQGPAGEFTRSVRFVGKPWAENFAEFVSRNPQRRWVFAKSTRPCTSQFDAERRALQDAARKLLPETQRHLQARRHRSGWSGAHLHTGEMLAVIEAVLRDNKGNIVVDRFAQRFVRPYGQVWQEAVLVDASSDSISRVAAALERQVQHRQQSWVQRGLGIGALLVMVCLVYWFLNTATKGYYLWSLRTGAVAAVIVGALVALAVV